MCQTTAANSRAARSVTSLPSGRLLDGTGLSERGSRQHIQTENVEGHLDPSASVSVSLAVQPMDATYSKVICLGAIQRSIQIRRRRLRPMTSRPPPPPPGLSKRRPGSTSRKQWSSAGIAISVTQEKERLRSTWSALSAPKPSRFYGAFPLSSSSTHLGSLRSHLGERGRGSTVGRSNSESTPLAAPSTVNDH